MPTPVVNDMGAGKTVAEWDAWTADMRLRHGNGNGHGASLAIEAARLLPSPRAALGDSRNTRPWVRPLDRPQNLENAIGRVELLGTPTAASTVRSASHGAGRAPSPAEVADALLPTPRTSDANGAGEHGGGGLTCEPRSDGLLATPTAWLGRRPASMKGDPQRWLDPERSNELCDQVAFLFDSDESELERERVMLPTPTASDCKVFGPNIDWEQRATHQPSLPATLMNLNREKGDRDA